MFTGFSDAVEASTVGSLTRHLDTKFVIGFDVAVTVSSPASSCVLFDITSRQLVELKWPMLNKHKRWFHPSRVKFPFVSMSASWFLVSVYLIWILGSTLILSNNQSRATLCHCRTSSLYDQLDHCFVVFKDVQHDKNSRLRKQNQHDSDHQSFQEFSFALEMYTGLLCLFTLFRISVKNSNDQIP